MDRKELKKRWIMGTVQPELFYIPWKQKHGDRYTIFIKNVEKTTQRDELVDYIEIALFNSYTLYHDYIFPSAEAKASYIQDSDKTQIWRYTTTTYAPDRTDSHVNPDGYFDNNYERYDYNKYTNKYWCFEQDEMIPGGYDAEKYMIPNADRGFGTGKEDFRPIIENSEILSASDWSISYKLLTPRSLIEIKNILPCIYRITTMARNIQTSWIQPYGFTPQAGMNDDPDRKGYYYDPQFSYPWYTRDENGVYVGALTDEWGDMTHYGENRFSTTYNYVNMNHAGKLSYFNYMSGLSWIDKRYLDLTEGKATTSAYLAVYELNRKLPNNTLILEGTEYTFSANVNVWQEDFYDINGELRNDRYSLQGDKYYYKPGDPMFYKYGFKIDNAGRAGDGYLGGCQFEVTYEDGTVSVSNAYAQQTGYSNGHTYAELVLKRGTNIIKCIQPPMYGGAIHTYENSILNQVSSMGDDDYCFDNDTHTETVVIDHDDLRQMKAGTFQPKTFDYYFTTPKLDIEIVKLGLPTGVTVYGDYVDNGRYESEFGSCYNYCGALKFTYRGKYYGYLQAGIAPVGLLQYHRGYYNNGHTKYFFRYIFNKEAYPDLDYDDPRIIDMTEPQRKILTAQSQIGRLNIEDDSIPGGGDWHYKNGAWHQTFVEKFGGVTLLEELGDIITYAHQSRYGTMTCFLGSNSGRLMITNYIHLGNCLNDTGGITTNERNQQYYFLGDGLTKEQANFFITCVAYRNGSVHITDLTQN